MSSLGVLDWWVPVILFGGIAFIFTVIYYAFKPPKCHICGQKATTSDSWSRWVCATHSQGWAYGQEQKR